MAVPLKAIFLRHLTTADVSWDWRDKERVARRQRRAAEAIRESHRLSRDWRRGNKRGRLRRHCRRGAEPGNGSRQNPARGGRRICRVLASRIRREIFERLRSNSKFRGEIFP